MIVEHCPFCLGDEQELISRSGPFMRAGFRVECEEIAHADEAQIRRVMAALDAVLNEPVDEWNNHLRKLAMVAVGAM